MTEQQKVELWANEGIKQRLKDKIRPALVSSAAENTSPGEHSHKDRLDKLASLTQKKGDNFISVSVAWVLKDGTKSLLVGSNGGLSGEAAQVLKDWINYFRAYPDGADPGNKFRDTAKKIFNDRGRLDANAARALGRWLRKRTITAESVVDLNNRLTDVATFGFNFDEIKSKSKVYHGELKIINYIAKNGIRMFKNALPEEEDEDDDENEDDENKTYPDKIYIGVDKTACQKCHRAYNAFPGKFAYAGRITFSNYGSEVSP
eukprot:CAMPEP_0114978520 /NCGR_PEP_ID=MMETSP0216-20121206/3853_1 /TAXON_ID=223996 /ORGANISM="Protocruzia adherens, Strain Boccale" /LENGTH=260 /DNA_ID=CAMNT_0002339727 /DNA_START=139 /DNA_END=921 /DNA_ORIENTATION=+